MSISGYASSMSVAPGGRIGLLFSSDTPAEPHSLFQRVGTGSAQPTWPPLSRISGSGASPWEGYGWTRTFGLRFPAAWPTGFTSDCNSAFTMSLQID